MFKWFVSVLMKFAESRPPSFIVGGKDSPYLLRWWIIPRNRFFNIYLHCFMRSDDDRALHDHPWFNFSVILKNYYHEHLIMAGGINVRRVRSAGDFVFRSPWTAHRVELVNGSCWTLFITGPRIREWGFHCPEEGWIHWERFTASEDTGKIGKGCQG